MDQYRSKLKLSENFERHWSIRISGEIHMDQSLVHTFSWKKLYGPMVLDVFLKFPPYTGIGPWMALPRQTCTLQTCTLIHINALPLGEPGGDRHGSTPQAACNEHSSLGQGSNNTHDILKQPV